MNFNPNHIKLDLHEDKNIFDEVLINIAERHHSKIKRVPRMASQNGEYYFTVLLEDFTLLELTLKIKIVYGIPAFEVEVEVY